MTKLTLRKALILGAALSLVFAGMALGQAVTGNVYGTVVDENGGPLPGVTVSISGIGATKTQITDAQGQYRFLSLDPGQWAIRAELEGYGSIEYPGVNVSIGRNTTIPLTLQQAVSETITVTSETPLLDERKLASGTQISQVELEKIPTARDPWAILNQTPGVLVDRINVGGNESGQQATFRAQGMSSDENDFSLDGVQITDMRATGASSTYYDFDQFSEMQFTTGGTDVTKNTAGVSVNLVTKRGSNEFRGSARFYGVKAGGYFGGALKQSQPNVAQSDLGNGQTFADYQGSQIREIEEVGFEAGGAVVRDKFWLWGSWGQNDIQQNAASGTADDTILENTSLKANAQFTQANSAVASWNNGDKLKFGRGAGTTRPDITTWNQRGPSASYRFEDTHVFSSSLFVTGTYSLGDFGFQLAAKGGVGPGNPESWRRSDGVWQDNYLSGGASSPNDEIKADASYFFNTADVSHELKVGGRFRNYESFSDFSWPGRDVFRYNTSSTSFVVAKRGVATPVAMEYFSLWAQDTIALGKATINVGLRYDDQSGVNEPYNVAANPAVPNVLPALNYGGNDKEFDWTSITPRLGFTYALGNERDTLVRASLSQFAQQLYTGAVSRTNPAGYSYAYFVDPAGVVDGPPPADWSQYNDPSAVDFAANFDPTNPTSLVSANVTDPGLDPQMTTEVLLGVEHALIPEFVIGLQATYRQLEDILETRSCVVTAGPGCVRTLRASDYFAFPISSDDGSFNGTGYDHNETTGGSLLLNGSREREYQGIALNFTKRLANQWMLRGFVNYGDAEWKIDQEYLDNSSPNRLVNGGDRDGDLYVERTTGSGKGERFLQSTWSANLNGMYQVAPDRPWGFNVSANIQAREGHPLPLTIEAAGTGGVITTGAVDNLDDFRLDDVTTADIRVEKEFNLTGPVNMTFGIDVFNITNEGTELSRNRLLSSSRAGWLQDNVSPRVYRLGARISWK